MSVRQWPIYSILQQPRLLNGFYPEQQGASVTGPKFHHSHHQAFVWWSHGKAHPVMHPYSQQGYSEHNIRLCTDDSLSYTGQTFKLCEDNSNQELRG